MGKKSTETRLKELRKGVDNLRNPPVKNSILLPKGQRMPDTREAFEYHAELAERALLKERKINAKLREELNKCKQKLLKYRLD